MRLRIRGPSGQSTVELGEGATVADLQSCVREKTGLSSYEVKCGYPPRPLDLSDAASTTAITSIGLANGEQLTVTERSLDTPIQAGHDMSSQTAVLDTASTIAGPSVPKQDIQKVPPNDDQDPPEVPSPELGGTFVLRVMPDDNSCLFRAVGNAVLGGMDTMTELRSIVAQAIQAQPARFTKAILGREPDEYCQWIQSTNSWGGQIELIILSEHFDIEICSIDAQSLRVDRYHEGSPTRCFIVYSGIHYDVIALSPSEPPYTRSFAPPEFDTRVFESIDPVALEKSVDLCRILQARHYYTDTAHFTLKCNDCGTLLEGEKGALKHAATTGHHDFAEAE
ncbi:Ovarian tumor, otubain [Ascosphaera apis ARSEF 7405]|uniref:Ubiquitin thioesterase OTU n=1 Tax=Ascosphaera apis ARSEF 7405 TaxID=392613 RepID=A0A167Y6Q3_9EURO|nr:Ovarian tumor, otubain [Ascosphaera apis ARSEF 7405]